MSLYEKIENDMKVALKEKDATKLSVLRMLLSAIKLFVIEKNIKTAEDADTLQIIQKQVKQHKESIEQFEKGGRKDLAEKEKGELKILESYLPKQLSEEEIIELVKAAIAETGAGTAADMGKVMKSVLEKSKGRCDGKTVSQLVVRFLK